MPKGQFTNPKERAEKISKALKGIKRGRPSEEHRKKISEALKGRPGTMKGKHFSLETREKMRKAATGRCVSNDTRKKLSIVNKEKHLSKTHKKKLSIANKGKHLSEETKKKISKSLKGRKQPIRSKETKRKISESKKGKPPWNKGIIGEKSHFWKGGISFLPYAFDFDAELKKLIKKRDKYICQLCQKRQIGKNLCIHHIDYDKQNSSPDNLMSLCWSCHGKTNNHRKSWIRFFNQKLKFA